ncbi:Uncharacterised protein [uncultured archaeon]|nr:Uncharacterised protein [uncultured archaeon]
MKNSLKAIILGTAIALTSCSPSIYDYNGKIGNELIDSLETYGFPDTLTLKVTKEDGRIISYYDWGVNRKIDSVTVTKDGRSQTFKEKDIIGAEAFKLAQQQFTDYLAKVLEIKKEILEAKKKQALEDIK